MKQKKIRPRDPKLYLRNYKKKFGKRQSWRTGLADCDIDKDATRKVFKGRGFQYEFISFSKRRNSKPELVVTCDHFGRAFKAISLLFCAITMETGKLWDITSKSDGRGWTLDYPKLFPIGEKPPSILAIPELTRAAAIASKASQKNDWSYSLVRYWLSFKACPVDWIDTHPKSSASLDKYNENMIAHTMFAQSIVSAYGVIEQLGLEMEKTNKSWKTDDGKWEDSLYKKLDDKLRRVNASCVSEHLWLYKNPKRIIDTKYIPTHRREPKVDFKRGNDSFVHLIDALYMASRIRSKVSTHKFDALTKTLTPYDVLNVRSLAKNLLISSMGLWDDHYMKISYWP